MMRKPLRLPKFSPPQVGRLSEKGRTLHALVSDNPLRYEVGLGGFDAATARSPHAHVVDPVSRRKGAVSRMGLKTVAIS